MSIILLQDVRLSFPHLAEPQVNVKEKTGEKRTSYNADFIMLPDHSGYKQFMARVGALAQEKWKEHAGAVLQLIQGDKRSRCYGSGEEVVNKKTFKPYDGYVGMVHIAAGKDTPPQVIQADGTPVDPGNTMAYQMLTRKMYGGCRVNVAVKPWVQDNSYGRGVRCDLVAIQFFKDDTPFGEGAVDASAMFGQVAAAPASVPSPAGAPAMGLPPFMLGQ